jgi:hypothetical protein
MGFIKATFKMVKRQALPATFGKMETDTKGCSRMIRRMDMDNSTMLKENQFTRVLGKMTK